MPYTDIYALESCLEIMGSVQGEEVQFIISCQLSAMADCFPSSIDPIASTTFIPLVSLRKPEDIYYPAQRAGNHPCAKEIRCRR